MSTVQASTKPLVLVTGGTGYIAGYAIEMLLEKGYNGEWGLAYFTLRGDRICLHAASS